MCNMAAIAEQTAMMVIRRVGETILLMAKKRSASLDTRKMPIMISVQVKTKERLFARVDNNAFIKIPL